MPRRASSSRGLDRSSCNPNVPISAVKRAGGELTDDRIAMEVEDRLMRASEDSWVDRSRDWTQNLLVTYGEQWIKYNELARRHIRKPIARDRRSTTNILAGYVESQLAKLIQGRPSFTAIPASPDLSERRSAKLAESMLLHDWRYLRLGLVRQEAILDCLLFGLGIIECSWDDRKGDIVREYETVTDELGNVQVDELGQPIYKLNTKDEPILRDVSFAGDVRVRARSPFSFFVPPGLETPILDESPWVITTDWMGEEEIRDTYDLKASEELGAEGGSSRYSESLSSYVQHFGTHQGMAPNFHNGQHLVVTYHERATDLRGFEFGKVYTCVNGKKIHEDRSQFNDGRYPFHCFFWMLRRGQFWPYSYVSPLVEVQMRYNQTQSHYMTHLNMFAFPNTLNPKGSGIPPYMAFGGRMYNYNPSAGKPELMLPPQPSAAIMQLGEQALADMDRVSRSYAIGRGEHQKGIPSALYAQMLNEAENTAIGPVINQHAEAWERLGESLIDLHRTYDSHDRMLEIVGKSNRTQLVAFERSQLPSRLRLVVAQTSMQTYSPAARIDQAKTLAKEGFFGAYADRPDVRRAILEFIRMPELTEIESGESLLLRAMEEIHTRLIEDGIEMQVPGWAQGEMAILEALKQALTERVIREDAWDWDDQTAERVVSYRESLAKALQETQEAQQEAELEQQRKQMGIQAEAETIKSGLRIKERALGEAAKAGTKLLAEQAGGGNGQGPQKGPMNGGGKKPPPGSGKNVKSANERPRGDAH